MKQTLVFVSAVMLMLPASRVVAQEVLPCGEQRCIFDQVIASKCSCTDSTNHGQYVSCVAHTVKALSDCKVLSKNCKGKVTRCAARSTCGKEGFSTCTPTCVTDVASGAMTCSDDPTVTCTTDADCGRCHTRKSGTCPEGTTESSGSCCATCAPPDCVANPGAPGCSCNSDAGCTSGNCCQSVGVCG